MDIQGFFKLIKINNQLIENRVFSEKKEEKFCVFRISVPCPLSYIQSDFKY